MRTERPPPRSSGASEPRSPLRRLGKLVGTWAIRGRTVGAARVDIRGTVRIEWLPGGLLMQQRSELRVGKVRVRSVEIVGYDPRNRTFPSFVYSNLEANPLPYRWEVRGDTIVHAGLGARFTGTFSEDARTLSGGWRPEGGQKATAANTYDVTMTRVG
jgi:Protein of unknown function (DUF1579)